MKKIFVGITFLFLFSCKKETCWVCIDNMNKSHTFCGTYEQVYNVVKGYGIFPVLNSQDFNNVCKRK